MCIPIFLEKLIVDLFNHTLFTSACQMERRSRRYLLLTCQVGLCESIMFNATKRRWMKHYVFEEWVKCFVLDVFSDLTKEKPVVLV